MLAYINIKNKKGDKVANQNGTVDEQWKMLYEQCKNSVEKRAQIDDWKKIKIKHKKKTMNSTCWRNQKYCSCNSALVSWVPRFFFLFNNRFVYFFSFKYWCKLTFILLYWHNKFHSIFTIIDVSISYKLK